MEIWIFALEYVFRYIFMIMWWFQLVNGTLSPIKWRNFLFQVSSHCLSGYDQWIWFISSLYSSSANIRSKQRYWAANVCTDCHGKHWDEWTLLQLLLFPFFTLNTVQHMSPLSTTGSHCNNFNCFLSGLNGRVLLSGLRLLMTVNIVVSWCCSIARCFIYAFNADDLDLALDIWTITHVLHVCLTYLTL